MEKGVNNTNLKENRIQSCDDIYYKYGNLMYKVAYSMTKDAQYAEDSVQDAFLYLTENFERINDVDSPKMRNYVCIVVKCIAIKRYRAEMKIVDVENINVEKFEPAAEECYIRNFDIGLVRSAIAQLDDMYKIPLVLKIIFGYKSKEIANIMNISDTNVRKRIYDAKKKIRKTLETNMLIDE